MTNSHDLHVKADRFAAKAARARGRTIRNTFLSLARSVRALAKAQAHDNDAGPEPRDPMARPERWCG